MYKPGWTSALASRSNCWVASWFKPRDVFVQAGHLPPVWYVQCVAEWGLSYTQYSRCAKVSATGTMRGALSLQSRQSTAHPVLAGRSLTDHTRLPKTTQIHPNPSNYPLKSSVIRHFEGQKLSAPCEPPSSHLPQLNEWTIQAPIYTHQGPAGP